MHEFIRNHRWIVEADTNEKKKKITENLNLIPKME